MVRFIYGNPGTGKTEYIYSCLSDDVKNGKPAILIVPEQMTVSAERDVIKMSPPSAQLSVEVLNFSRLANRLFREHGGLAYNFASSGLQKLMMWRALHASIPFLKEYQISSYDDSALSNAMLATYKELTACGISLNDLESTAISNTNSILSGKIRDISTVCSIYSAMLNEKYTDANNELSRLAALLEEKACLIGHNIYIDGFTSFTGIEHRIIKALISQADLLAITFGIPFATYSGIDTLSLRQCSNRLRRDCASLGIRTETTELIHNYRAESAELEFLSSDLWTMDSDSAFTADSHDNPPVELFRAADIYDECEFAAATIRKLVESGYKFKDIAVISRNIDKYRGIIEPALDNMELKYFISEKIDLSLSPIARLIISAIRIVIFGWKRADVIAHLKTGLCGISPRDADIFECYTAKWNISGKKFISDAPWNMNPDGYTTVKSERGELILQTVNAVKTTLIGRLRKFVAELKSAETYTDMCVATLNYLEMLEVRETMLMLSSKYLSKNKLREASDHARMYDIAIDALDCVCDAFPNDIKPDLNTFSTAIRIAFAESDLGSIPTSQDEITLGSANMLRTGNIKCAIILGACDGEFPANTESAGLFTDHDREYLIAHGLPMSGDRQLNASDELYYFRRAVSAASEKLIIFTRADSEPSIAFTRIRKIFPCISVHETSSLLLPRLRSQQAVSEYAPLLKGTNEGEALARLMNETGSVMSDNEDIELSSASDFIDEDAISSLIGNDLRLSQSKVELFSNCKFAYSCKYYLNLDDGRRAEFAYNNIGTFIHYVLEKFLYYVFISNRGALPDEVEKEDMVNSIIDKYINDLLPDENHKSARLLHLISRLKQTSLAIINDLLYEFSDSSFKPEFFELRIGTKELPSIRLTLKNGTSISLSGIIDRVDVYRNNGKAYIRVTDYKTGSKTFSVSDIAEGLNLQLLLYIFSLTKQTGSKAYEYFGGIPVAAGITYLSSGSSKIKAERIKDADAELKSHAPEIKRTGLILDDNEVISALSRSGNDRFLMRSSRKNSFIDSAGLDVLYDNVCNVLTDIGNEMVSGNINALPKHGGDTCKHCQYASICRASKKS